MNRPPLHAVGTKTLRTAIYCRISLARFGVTVKVDDQEKDCRRVASGRCWSVAPEHVYKDSSKSAWRRDRKRPQWDAMLAAYERGEFDAIVVYHGDRLIRQPYDLELLIRLADEKGLRLASPTGERNLDDPDDRYILRIEAAHACREVDNTSRRMKRHHRIRAEAGLHRPGGRGGRAFGFETDGVTHRPDEVAVIREVAERLLTHEKTGAIAADLTERGIRTTAGNGWDHGALKKLMMRPRLAGLLQHGGEIVGEAAWAPVLERDTWESVQFVLARKAAGFDYATNARRYELTGIARCGSCGESLSIRHNSKNREQLGYGCINRECESKVHRAVHHLDAYVRGVVLARLADPELAELLHAGEDTSEAVAKLKTAEQRRLQLLEDFGDDDELGSDVLRVSVARVDRRIEELKATIRRATVGHVLDGLLGITLPEWERLPLSRRRAAIATLVEVTVFKSRKGPGFDRSTVSVEPREVSTTSPFPQQ